MALKTSMEQTTYSRKESGKSPITDEEWERFAKSLKVEVEDLKDTIIQVPKNENCTFNDSSIGIQYVSIPQEVLNSLMKYIKLLEERD